MSAHSPKDDMSYVPAEARPGGPLSLAQPWSVEATVGLSQRTFQHRAVILQFSAAREVKGMRRTKEHKPWRESIRWSPRTLGLWYLGTYLGQQLETRPVELTLGRCQDNAGPCPSSVGEEVNCGHRVLQDRSAYFGLNPSPLGSALVHPPTPRFRLSCPGPIFALHRRRLGSHSESLYLRDDSQRNRDYRRRCRHVKEADSYWEVCHCFPRVVMGRLALFAAIPEADFPTVQAVARFHLAGCSYAESIRLGSEL